MKDLRLLIGGSSSFFFHLQEFSNTLNNLGIESKLVFDADYSDGFPGRKIGKWFQTGKKFTKLIDEYKPDAIFIDRQRHFGINSLKAGIPLFVLLRGHYWSEMDWNKRTMYRSFPKRIALSQWDKIGKEIFAGATAILPICKYLEKITKKFVPGKPTNVFSEGVDASKWYNVEGLELKHPCVGLLQYANWWGKTSEMLVLKKVLERMPDVHFYWVGDGPLRERVLSELNGYNNFHWLGRLQYPDKVREYLSEIDVYALLSGIDMSPLTLQEAQLMQKPVVATNVGGIPELIKNNETGFLVKKGDHEELFEKLEILLNDNTMSKKMGNAGRDFISNNFSWEIISRNFKEKVEKHLDLS